MKLLMIGALACAALGAPGIASAGEATDRLGQCLVETSTPRDQAALMRWMFSALSLNPALKSMTSLTEAQRDEATRNAAALFNRLMLQDCRKEAAAALKSDGTKAIEGAFAVLGKRAAEQLLSDGGASAEMGKLAGYLDESRFGELFKEAGLSK